MSEPLHRSAFDEVIVVVIVIIIIGVILRVSISWMF